MKIINSIEELKKLLRNNIEINDIIFDFSNTHIDLDNTFFKNNTQAFTNCTFKSLEWRFMKLNDRDLNLHFNNCSFFCELLIIDCRISSLNFIDIQKINSLNIYSNELSSEFDNFFITSGYTRYNKANLGDAKFYIANSSFKYGFQINGINLDSGRLSIIDNVFEQNYNSLNFKIVNNVIKNFNFNNNLVNSNFTVNYNFFKNYPIHKKENKEIEFFDVNYFSNNTLNQIFNFNNNTFEYYFQLIDNTFNQKLDFSQSKCDNEIIMTNNNFNGVTYFENSEINKFVIHNCNFEKSSSFNNSNYHKLILSNVKFDKTAFFENTKIEFIIKQDYLNSKELVIWKNTIRTIKHEFLKYENRFEYNYYKSNELRIHYKELSWLKNLSDKLILFLLKISSDFGTNWMRALYFTILSGISIYLLLYSIENYNLKIDITNYDNCSRFISGLFRFFLVTDFYNPLETDRVYLSNPFSWIIFIFGKIVIAFGIYEMIQSFRKFKA